MDIFKQQESNVQTYARSFPVVFNRAEGARIFDCEGNAYIDFLAGAGSLNYGHNNPHLKEALIEYIQRDGITHGLDMHTDAKARFLTAFKTRILEPRGLDHVVQFTGPTGANAVEAALKIARKVTGRHNVIAFTNGFHGVTLGALALTGNQHHRGSAGLPLSGVTRMPYAGYLGSDVNTLALLKKTLNDASSGVDMPAAVIVEVVQGEGGLNTASTGWLKELQSICRSHDILLIVDDIQAGCGRTGTFFSFEGAGISPDIITLSKSLSGYGLPMAITLIRRELDQWEPGEHNGTFRGNNHAFVTATAALEKYWGDDQFQNEVKEKAALLSQRFKRICDRYGVTRLQHKGRGLMQGIRCQNGEIAEKICRHAFSQGLMVETAGSEGQVVKCLCPLTITHAELTQGLDILESSFAEVFGQQSSALNKAG
ncbi:MAG: diaminobutyrate--2-oxoglutarate transaminase [Hahellaceae bacterium]|nr:diaminobutyrate--2-oxoglutarate transaminase [Hahellaceae bacterium]MCP5168183.1 diaminobutyrate--2-oxoglutarate transaminase [Hahellaceae bacterium]